MSLYKFAFDLRLLQSQPIGEISEPFEASQVGSSAMPFKRNPILSEKINSLARYLAQMPQVAWNNAAHSLLERTLDDSANRRSIIPESFLLCDELITTCQEILLGMQVFGEAIQQNLRFYGAFANTEKLIIKLVQAGANRQTMHEKIRLHTMAAWASIQTGRPIVLSDLICSDTEITDLIPNDEIKRLLESEAETGIAPQTSLLIAKRIRELLRK